MGLADLYTEDTRTSPYGRSAGYDGFHKGTDFDLGDVGAAVLAIWGGVVVHAGWQDSDPDVGHGLYVVIRRDDGKYCSYSHLSSVDVSEGQQIAAGARIGGMGNTGASLGAHVHVQVSDVPYPWCDPSQTTDPWPQIEAAVAGNRSPEEDPIMTAVIAHVATTGARYVWNLDTREVQHIPDTYQLGVLQRLLKTVTFDDDEQFDRFRGSWYGETLDVDVDLSGLVQPTVPDAQLEQLADRVLAKIEDRLAAVVAAQLAPYRTLPIDELAAAIRP